MAIPKLLSALLLISGLAQALIIPGNERQHDPRADTVAIDSQVKVVLSSFATLEQLAKELTVDLSCLRAANPLLSALRRGQYCTVPHACCGSSCGGKFCSKRPQCHGQSTTPAPPVQNEPSTTFISTITTSLSSGLTSSTSTSSTRSLPSSVQYSGSSTGLVPSESSSQSNIGSIGTTSGPISGTSSTVAGLPTTTNSLGQTIISDSSTAVASATGISSGVVETLPGGSVTTIQTSSVPSTSSSASLTTTTNPIEQSITSSGSGGVDVSTGLPSADPTPAPGNSSVTGQLPSGLPPSDLPSSGLPSSRLPSSSPRLVATTNSLGQTIVLPPGGSSTNTAPNLSATVQPSEVPSSIIPGVSTTTNSLGQTIISGSSGVTISTTGGPIVTTQIEPDGSIITFVPSATADLSSASSGQLPSSSGTPAVITTTNSAGETIVSSIAGSPSSGQPSRSSATPSVITTTDSAGETIISTLAGGSPTSVLQFSPSSIPSAITTTNSAGETINSSIAAGAPSSALLPSPSSTPSAISTTNSAGETISTSTLAEASPTSVASLTTFTNTDGSVVISTLSSFPASQQPSANVSISTTAAPVGNTTISEPGQSPSTSSTSASSTVTTDSSVGTITSTSIASSSQSSTSDLTSTNSDGPTTGSQGTSAPGPVTSPPPSTSSSSTAPPGVIPITTSVPEPKATDDGTEIPCSLWFFSICIEWLDTSILGWKINLPPGTYPPGPPPGITFPPGISFSVSGTIPDWPTLTIGPDRLPTYEPEPEECKTESAELCLTSTSFGVSSTDGTVTTTASEVLSTCATVYGCDVSDSSTSTASTSTASDYPYSCTFGCSACNGRRDLPPPTDVPSHPTPIITKPASLVSFFDDFRLLERDIPNRGEAEIVADFYDAVRSSPNTVNVEHYLGIQMLTTSQFIPFDASERNLRIEGLVGCTSILVVSQLGAYISHIWEPTFTVGDAYQAQAIDYLNNGRPGEAGTEALQALVQRNVFGDTATTKIFIMTPAIRDLDLNDGSNPSYPAVPDRDQRRSLRTSADQPLFDGNNPDSPVDRLTPIRNELGTLMPGVPISQFVYRRQNNPAKAANDAYGKAVIVYSNLQKEDPDTFDDIAPTTIASPDGTSCEVRRQKAVWQCYIQDFLMGSDMWDALPAQIATNQKRQVGDCGSPSSTLISSSAPTSTSAPISTPVSSPAPTSTSAPISTPPPLTDLPDLTSTAFSTPSGSSCASTTTFSQCNGSGGQAACITTSSCASFVATETSSTAFPTPSGSSCASTTTFSQCNGSGGRAACITTSSCASFVATDTPTPTSSEPTSTTYEAPLFTSPTVCNNENDFPGHADVKSGAQANLAQDFCGSHNTWAYPGRGPPLAETLQDGDDINYFYSISWKDQDCRPQGDDRQNTYNPQGGGGITCPLVMEAIYLNCDNGGVGGYMDVGCLRYRFNGAI